MSVDFTTTNLRDTVLSHYIFDEFEADPDINHIAQRCLERLEEATHLPLIVTEQAGPVEKLRSVFRSVMGENTPPPTAAQRGNLAEYYRVLKTQKNEELKESRLIFWNSLAEESLDLDHLEGLSGNEVEIEFRKWLDEHPECLEKTKLEFKGSGFNFVRFPYLPPEIGLFTQLKHLALNYNFVAELPPEIGNLTQLETLEINNHHLRRLPPEIGCLTQLRRLDIHNSNHSEGLEIPSEIGKLTQLESLDLAENRKLKNVTAIESLSQLQDLDLMMNGLTECPKEICRMTQLRQLSLSMNELTQLPPQLANLRSLEYFDIKHNPIQEIEPVLAQMLGNIEVFRRDDHLMTQTRKADETEAQIAQVRAEIGLLSMMPPAV